MVMKLSEARLDVLDFTISWQRIVLEVSCVIGAIVMARRYQEASFLAVSFLVGLTIVELFLSFYS
jgi:hypothetical protein